MGLRRVSRRRAVVAGGLALLLAVAGGGAWWWRAGDDSRLAAAMALAPGDAERFTWTDWAGVRRELGASLEASSPVEEVESFLLEGYDADLTATSSLVDSSAVLHESFGWSPATMEWELMAQGPQGVLVAVGLPQSLTVDDVRDRLEEIGYTPPGSEDGVWSGGEDLLATVARGAPISPALEYVALDEEAHALLGSDLPAYLSSVLEGETGLDQLPRDVTRVVEASGEALSATLMTGDRACADLAMGQADPVDQAQADELLAAAGEVSPLRGWAMAVQPGREVRVAMSFQSDEQARTNADTRARLAAGPAPGQGGDFTERFELGEVVADGRLLTMALRPVEGAAVMSDLSDGPVLFSTC